MDTKWRQSMVSEVAQYGLNNRFNRTLMRLGVIGVTGSFVCSVAYYYGIYVPRKTKYHASMKLLNTPEKTGERSDRMAKYGIVGVSAPEERAKVIKAARLLNVEPPESAVSQESLMLADFMGQLNGDGNEEDSPNESILREIYELDENQSVTSETIEESPVVQQIMSQMGGTSILELYDRARMEIERLNNKPEKTADWDEEFDNTTENVRNAAKLVEFWMKKNVVGATECLESDDIDIPACRTMLKDLATFKLESIEDTLIPKLQKLGFF